MAHIGVADNRSVELKGLALKDFAGGGMNITYG